MANNNSRNSAKNSANKRTASGAKGSAKKPAGSTKSTVKGSKGSANTRGSSNAKKGGYISGITEALRGDDSRSRIIRTFLKIVLVFAAILLIVMMWRNRVDCSWSNVMQSMRDAPYMTGVGSGYPVSVLGSDALAQERIANGMAVLTDTNLTVYNTSSKQVASRAHYMTTPAMKTAGRYALLMDIGGTKYRVEAISDTLVEQKAEKVIIGGALARNGSYAIITQGSDYSNSKLSSVEVFDINGEPIHIWHSADHYITEAALSADGRYLAVCGVWAREGELLSCIMIHKMGSKEEVARIELPKSLGLSLEFTNTGTLYAVCDNQIVVINGYGSEHKSYEYNGTLQAYDINYENGAAVYTSPVLGESAGILTTYDSRGQKRFEKNVPLYGVSVSLGDNGCCVLGRGGATAFHLSGEQLNSWETGISAENVLLIGSRAYIIEGISVEQYKVS